MEVCDGNVVNKPDLASSSQGCTQGGEGGDAPPPPASKGYEHKGMNTFKY